MRKLRAVLIEDETMFRQLILLTLGKVKDLQVIGEFGLGKPGLEFCLREKPDMLVVDLMLPDINGMEIAREVRRALPEMKILVITAHPSERLPADLMVLGVNGYVEIKPSPLNTCSVRWRRCGAAECFLPVGCAPKAEPPAHCR
jgi:DNA-binding NarL/FixJ family response regulator